uniref:Glycosyltransferase subfamily 4-like N-terminal domain-containing protein n=1 Tax=Ananas comosus var. bracteatus TaxID=296719 RepID=A0A6V7Q9S5_ANACO|nr:unnamed protein product [Ananas comosus var. bracteatus]
MAAVVIFHRLCRLLFAISFLTSLSFLFWSRSRSSFSSSSSSSPSCRIERSEFWLPPDPTHPKRQVYWNGSSIDLLSFSPAWNILSFPSEAPPPKTLKLAVFVKRWPRRHLSGGLERHALTLHLALARRGHQVHVFTTSPPSNSSNAAATDPELRTPNLTFHLSPPTKAGYIDQPLAWAQFRAENASGGRQFDAVHTESVALRHGRARNLSNLAASWHGIAYETIHSDVVQGLLRSASPAQPSAVPADRLARVVDEVRFFRDYKHHVATSDHVGDVLRRVYMVPEDRVHVIVNGVDDGIYYPDPARGYRFRREVGVPNDTTLVIGMGGRLVKDKGHPLMFEALKQVFEENESFYRSTVILVAGDGPWGNRYKELGPNMLVLGPLDQARLASFYNSLDVFLNPTLRAQGLDHTIIEAMMSGVPVAATWFASITGSLIVGPELGYTFHPTVDSLKESLCRIWKDGRVVLKEKGGNARNRAVNLFTATKMASAYERLFLCIAEGGGVKGSSNKYCRYP